MLKQLATRHSSKFIKTTCIYHHSKKLLGQILSLCLFKDKCITKISSTMDLDCLQSTFLSKFCSVGRGLKMCEGHVWRDCCPFSSIPPVCDCDCNICVPDIRTSHSDPTTCSLLCTLSMLILLIPLNGIYYK